MISKFGPSILAVALYNASSPSFSQEFITLSEFDRPEGASYTYVIRDVDFADVNGDGDEELVTTETGHKYPIGPIVTISRLAGGRRELIWESSRLWFVHKMLIGDIDGDKIAEIIHYGPRFDYYSEAEKTLRLIRWDGSRFLNEGFIISGTLGTLADINNNGKKELVLAEVSKRIGDAEGLDPVTLRIYSFNGTDFEDIYELPFSHAISTLSAGDLDGDGIAEIITEENSVNGDIKSQISVYKVNDGQGLTRIISLNHALPLREYSRRNRIHTLTAIESEGAYYLYVEFGQDHKQWMYSLSGPESGNYRLIRKEELTRRNVIDGAKSAMIHSREANKFVRVNRRRLEYYSEDEIAPYQ